MYAFQVCWVPGKMHFIADALSRAPLFAPSQPSLNIVYAAIDEDYKNLILDVQNNTCVSSYSRALKGNMDDLSVSDGLVLLDSRRIVLPLSAIKPVLRLLHSSHSGITKTTALARGLYFWPGMTNDI